MSNSNLIKKSYSEHSAENIQHFKSILNEIYLSDIIEINCPNNAYNSFMYRYKNTFDESFPLKIKHIITKRLRREPWIKGYLHPLKLNLNFSKINYPNQLLLT